MRSKLAFSNSLFNTLSLSINAIFSFIIRKCLIQYLGVEILGVNAVISETLNTLSLAELGIQTAISYRLYKPVAEEDEQREGEIFALFKSVYRIIGTFILIMGILVSPCLGFIIHTSLDKRLVWSMYIIQLIAVVLPYFFSCYRILFLVHQKQYFCTKVDIISYIGFSVIQLLVVVIFRNYILYLLVAYAKFFVSNGVLINKCKKEFTLTCRKFVPNKDDKKLLSGDVKEIIWGNFAGYVYSSTDSLIISAFCGTLLVGYISNYKTITTAIRSCGSVLNNSMVPSWGNFMQQNTDEQRFRDLYYMLIFLEFVMCSILLIPTLCLADSFITIWLGEEFIISHSVLILIVMDIYINTIHEPNAIIMRSLGMFKQDKWCSIWATVTNLVFSFGLVRVLGVEGVLIGTILALFVFWIYRSKIINKRCFNNNNVEYLYYGYKNVQYAVLFIIQYFIVNKVLNSINIKNSLLGFAFQGIISEIIIIALVLLFFGRRKEVTMVINTIVKPIIDRRK